jgi:hypothetical protein
MNRNWLYFILLIIVISILQLAFGSGFGFLVGRINLVLVALVVLINFIKFDFLMIFAVAVGFILDVYSALPFGIITLSLFSTVVVGQFLFLNFFTNFSFYSLIILGFISVFVYHLFLLLMISFLYFFGLSDVWPQAEYFINIVWQFLTAFMLLVLSYYFINLISRKFNPNFLQ